MMKFIFAAFILPMGAQAVEVKTETEMNYRRASDTATQTLKKDESLKLGAGEQVLFTGENRVPLLVVAPGKTSSTVLLTDAQQNEFIQEATRKKVNSSVSEIVSKLMNLENLIRARNFTGAQAMIEDLKVKYPRVAAIYFASGTTNFLMNKKSVAAADLEKGLALEPDNADAKKLLQRIKGGT